MGATEAPQAEATEEPEEDTTTQATEQEEEDTAKEDTMMEDDEALKAAAAELAGGPGAIYVGDLRPAGGASARAYFRRYRKLRRGRP